MSNSNNIDYEQFGQLVGKLVAGLAAALSVQIKLLKLDPLHFEPIEKERFVGYVWGLSDVMAQHVGFKSSSEISQGMFSGVMKIILQMSPEQALTLLETHASQQGPEFINGVRAGGEDAGLLRQNNANLPGFSACFGPPVEK